MIIEVISSVITPRKEDMFDGGFFDEEETLTQDDMNYFDFNFSDDLSVRSDVIFSDISCSETSNTSIESVVDKYSAGKCSLQKRGSKFMKKALHSSKYKSKSATTYVGTRVLRPNMSRRTRDTMLYAFPSFDRCDSLLFFPSTLARHLNAGDIPSVTKLFLNHFDKNCTFGSPKDAQSDMTLQSLIRKYEILDDLLPDRITCIHSTHVEGNKIRALSFSKFTNCRAIYDSLACTLRNTEFAPIFRYSWSDHLRHKIEQGGWSPEEKERHLALVDAGCDVLVYSRMEFVLTIDEMTKKVVNFYVNMRTTAIHEARHSTDDQC